jgi:hypothetical protein
MRTASLGSPTPPQCGTGTGSYKTSLATLRAALRAEKDGVEVVIEGVSFLDLAADCGHCGPVAIGVGSARAWTLPAMAR